jgi:hypothetical protein
MPNHSTRNLTMPPCFEERVITARLPVELIVSIAEILAGDLCFESIANVNITCRIVHEETLPVLFETLQLQYSQLKAEAMAAECSGSGTSNLPCGWGYARRVFVPPCDPVADKTGRLDSSFSRIVPSEPCWHKTFPSCIQSFRLFVFALSRRRGS